MIQRLAEKYLIQLILGILIILLAGGFLGFKAISKIKGGIENAKNIIFSPDSDYNSIKLPE
jgi:hypothetical protein